MTSLSALKVFFIALVSLSLMACTSIKSQRNGPVIDVFPVIHTLSLSAKDNSFEHLKTQLVEKLKEYDSLLVSHSVALSWTNEASEKLAKFTEQRLLSMGVAPDHIIMTSNELGTEAFFDFEMKVIQYRVSTENCGVSKINSYDSFGDGCYTENARWRSMIAPERMLSNHKQLQE
ncbi:hypothetical protein ACPUEK_05680 [Marinomonas gallaica]|uniref:hypothetical protein n=1 Tax=Marinomonas gallaica TaxID=1806667 RepID=UPI003CE47E0D